MAYVDRRNRAPKTERLPDSRLRVTYVSDVLNFAAKTPAQLLAEVWQAWGTADSQFTGCRLVQQDVSGQLDGPIENPEKSPPQLTQVYEEMPINDQIQVGNPSISYDQYGNKTAAIDYIQLSAGTTTYSYVVGTTAAPAPNNDCILKISEATNDGTLIRTKRTFISSGELSDTEQIKFDGKLVIREITSLGTAPATPSGWTLVTQSTDFILGRQVFRYGFVNGGGGGSGGGTGGVISTETAYERSPDQGTTGVTVTTIKYISAPSVSSNPTTGPVGSELISVIYADDDGYRLWTAVYASGQGNVSSTIDIRNNGKLIIYSKTSINAAPSAPSPTIGGTVVLIHEEVSNGTRVEDGTIIYEYQWAEGVGVIDKRIQQREGGLRLETWVSLGTAYDAGTMKPVGILNVKDEEEIEGMKKFTVTCTQQANGTDPTSGTVLNYGIKRQFKYPGRAKAYTTDFTAVDGFGGTYTAHAHDVFLSPPADILVDATVLVTYQTSNAIGSLTYPLWNPDTWATVRAFWSGWGPTPRSIIQSHYGYRSVGSAVTFTAGAALSTATVGIVNVAGSNNSCMGERVFALSSGSITVSGGPSSPDGNTYTLAVELEPAFFGLDGTQYYRRTVIQATIPTQPALPV